MVGDKLGLSYQNLPDPKAVFSPTTPVPRASFRPDLSKDSFIGIAISGGGSRAANFGMAVLAELDQLGILAHVDAISAVSGGAIPTAHFALNGDKPGWAEQGKALARTNFLGAFLAKLVNPVNFTATTFTDKDRTDLLAEVMSDKVFAGQKPNFSALGAKGPMRPSIFFNATDTTSGGERFVFSDDRFLKRLGSDLDQYPIPWAMASSGAFPGIFNSVTMRRYSQDPELRKVQEGPLAERNYIHLIDGGTADNLGTDTLTDMARSHFVELANRGRKQSACMFIVIDSHVPGSSILDGKRSDRRNPFAMIMDMNFLDAIDAMLGNRRLASLQELGIQKDVQLGRFDIDMGGGLIEYNVAPYRRVSQFKVRYYQQAGLALREARTRPMNDQFDLTDAPVPESKTFECTAWHVALEDIHSIISWQDKAGALQPTSAREAQDHELFAYRARLSRVLKQLKTNYKLDGPPHCSAQFLQESLYDAAHIAVREDKTAMDKVCAVMKQAGIQLEQSCKVTGTARFKSDYRIESINRPANAHIDEQSINRFVRCPEVQNNDRATYP